MWNEDAWLRSFKKLESKLEGLTIEIRHYKKSGDIKIKRNIDTVLEEVPAHVLTLEDNLRDGDLAASECGRREGMLGNLRAFVDNIDGLYKESKVEARNARNARSGKGGSNSSKPRETETTKQYDNHCLLKQQQIELGNQDDQLDLVAEGVAKLKGLSHGLTQELDLHDRLLSDMDERMAHTELNIKKQTKTTDTLVKNRQKESSCAFVCTAGCLLLVIFLLIFTNSLCVIFNPLRC